MTISELTDRFNALAKQAYGGWKEEQTQFILGLLPKPIDGDQVLKVLESYIRTHRFMPTLADINEGLDELNALQVRAVRDRTWKERQKESDATYQNLMAGKGLDERAQYWAGQVKAQVALSNQYRSHFQAKYGLDFAKPAHVKFLMRLLDECRDANQLLLPLSQADGVADRIVAQIRAEKAKSVPSVVDRGPAPLSTGPTHQNAPAGAYGA